MRAAGFSPNVDTRCWNRIAENDRKPTGQGLARTCYASDADPLTTGPTSSLSGPGMSTPTRAGFSVPGAAGLTIDVLQFARGPDQAGSGLLRKRKLRPGARSGPV